jgi:hypothetical protein
MSVKELSLAALAKHLGQRHEEARAGDLLPLEPAFLNPGLPAAFW